MGETAADSRCDILQTKKSLFACFYSVILPDEEAVEAGAVDNRDQAFFAFDSSFQTSSNLASSKYNPLDMSISVVFQLHYTHYEI